MDSDIIEACFCCKDQPAEDDSEYCDECELQGCTATTPYCHGEPRPLEVVRKDKETP